MMDETDFEIFVCISKNKYQIYVFDKNKLENLYHEELNTNKFNFEDLTDFSMFLDKNIYKIEKLVGNFIKNIVLIITNDNNLNVNIAIKKNFFDKSVKQKYLESILTEIKDLFLENYQDQMIMHMIVDNYIVNDQKYSKFENNLLSNNLGLEVNFVSISKDLVFLIDKILENYQIKISQYMSGTYVKNFFNDDKSDISIMAHRLKNGYNENEVVLVPKNIENKGFFEKFFQLFS